jgi:hypothetical protein
MWSPRRVRAASRTSVLSFRGALGFTPFGAGSEGRWTARSPPTCGRGLPLGGLAVDTRPPAQSASGPDGPLPNIRSTTVLDVTDLPIPELVENRRRSIAMLPAGAPALNRDDALELLEQLQTALHEVRTLQAELRD